jgi:hypothetical protein
MAGPGTLHGYCCSLCPAHTSSCIQLPTQPPPRWFRTPETNTPTFGDRTWITRNPTQFTFGSVRRSTSISRHPLSLSIDQTEAIELSVLDNPPPGAKSIKRTRDFMVDYQERKEGHGSDETFMNARGLNRSIVVGPLASNDGIWDG